MFQGVTCVDGEHCEVVDGDAECVRDWIGKHTYKSPISIPFRIQAAYIYIDLISFIILPVVQKCFNDVIPAS